MRHQISSCLAGLALLLLAACAQAPVEPRTLATYPVANVPMTPDEPGTGSIVTTGVDTAITATDDFPTGGTVRIGLLLPLTGRNAELGKALQDAATLSLFDKYGTLSTRQATVKVELLPRDTGDTPEQAVQAMREVLDAGAVFVIGPLFGDATEAAAPIARERGISVLSLSNNAAHGGKGVYMYGFSPQEQAARVVNYTLMSGKSRIAAMVPDSALGTLVLESARQALSARGFVLAREVRYTPQGTGINAALDGLLPAGQPDFDALLLPEGGPALSTILRSLPTRGIDRSKIQLLGTGIWDDAALVRRVPLDGAWLASSPPKNTATFENRFRDTYQYVPPRVASLAYDAVALAVTLGTSGRAFDEATLTSDAGFTGPANGVFRLRPNGTTERGLAVMQVQTGLFQVISPAPTGFQQ